jgi:NAD+--dinitrogen-reductase ADP-D-ribosyltransferase
VATGRPTDAIEDDGGRPAEAPARAPGRAGDRPEARRGGARPEADAAAPAGAWRRGTGTNLIGIPSAVFASAAFNDDARPVHIAGAREMNPDLFRLLDRAASPAEAADAFTTYMAAMFGLQAEPRPAPAAGVPGRDGDVAARRYRTSYLRLLRGWAYDSNSPEGAVLKGWVESRFGLVPTFHREPLDRFHSAAWARYVEEKIGSRFHNNAILSQLDLLYEFAQWVQGRFHRDAPALRLYRGVNDFDEHPIVERLDRRRVVVRLNNLVSFTEERDMATWFGDLVLETTVPAVKVLFFNALLPRHALKGEGEVLVIGGDYLVAARYS